MNRRYDIRYLEDPKDALGPTNDPARLSTIVRGGPREEDPEAGDPRAGARRWVSANREVVRPWIEAARKAR
jgi:ABC-type proline/glycine betaine transport system substrate-binding protein